MRRRSVAILDPLLAPERNVVSKHDFQAKRALHSGPGSPDRAVGGHQSHELH